MANLASTQLEQLREIGAYLRQVRQQQGLALDDIANQIFIRPTLLRAVEEGQDQHLPEPVFVQGFIRRYGDALGLDGSELAQNFTVIPVGAVPEMPAAKAASKLSQSNGRVESESRQSIQPLKETSATQRSRQQDGPPLGLIGALVVLAVGVGLGFWSWNQRNSQPLNAQSSQTRPQPTPVATPTPAPVATSEPASTPTVVVSPNPPLDAPVVADVELKERSWVSVVADGSTVFEGILEKGTAETWKAQTSLQITSGNAGGVALSFNGATPITLGNPGSVRTLTLTPTTDPASLTTP